jgi:hypothetical protein
MSELMLTVLKFVAIVLTAVFGVLTILAGDKERSRLTKKGRIALAAAVASGVVAVVTQVVEFDVDRIKRQKAAAETAELLRNIQRGIYPLFNASLLSGARWRVPLADPALAGYSNRLRSDSAPHFPTVRLQERSV